ncbi:MAG TPA: hypothetical protein VG826_30020 [Pirellulales bacterium]|nr:hypothetical protein [Pirellulales bacterium]
MRLTASKIAWLASYLAAMSAVVAALMVIRARVLSALDTPDARRQWQSWKEETQRKSAGPIERRPVRSDEPPALILLRDRFPAVVVSSVMICSFLFAFLGFAARGAFRSTTDEKSEPLSVN